ncbi:MAG: hypothetical protein EOO45_23885 [Flavobacterium sp.]|nr:MAG: hypothetical protein EOO45_23885 [Flavobacterium sp.]
MLVLLAAYGIIAFSYLRLEIKDLDLNLKAAYAVSYTTIEYLFFASFFYLSMKNKGFRRLILALSAAFVVFQVLFFINVKDDNFRLDTIPIGVETILLFIYTFCFFYENMKSSSDVNLYNSFGFWIAVGILLYLGVSFFLYILANDMNQQEIDLYWPVTYVAEMIKNLVFCVAIFMYRPKNHDPKKNFRPSQDGIPHLI